MMTRRVFAYKRETRHGHPRSDGQGHVLAHVLIAERVLGRPLPPGAEVHHVDEDTVNNAHANLVICQDRAYHFLLHLRARVRKAGGNPNTDAICSTCREVKPLSAFNRCTHNKATGRQTQCRQCQSEYCKRYKRPLPPENDPGRRDPRVLVEA